jgi:hypothetical protein
MTDERPLTLAQRHRLRFQEQAAERAAEAEQAQAEAAAAAKQKMAAPVLKSPATFVRPEGAQRLSPAQRHRAIVVAGLAILAAGAPVNGVAPDRPETGPEATEYDLLRARFGADLDTLRDIKAEDGKVAAKVKMLPAYADHIDAVLRAADESGKGVQDEVFVMLMIWQFDVGAWDAGLIMAEHVLKYGLSMPERFSRSAATVITEQPAEAALKAASLNEDFPLDVLQHVQQLTGNDDVNGIVRAKLHKAIAQQLVRVAVKAAEAPADAPAGGARGAYEQALTHFKEALRLHTNSGVKKDIERVTAALKKFDTDA